MTGLTNPVNDSVSESETGGHGATHKDGGQVREPGSMLVETCRSFEGLVCSSPGCCDFVPGMALEPRGAPVRMRSMTSLPCT